MSFWQGYQDAADWAHGARSVDPRSPRAAAHHKPLRLLGAALDITVPDPPCAGCPKAGRCAVRREVCRAYREYVQTGRRLDELRGKGLQRMKKFRD
jgi:hypothetical protein